MMSSSPVIPSSTVVQDTVKWLERAVIGLNLCPFAKSVHVKGQVHYAVSRATTAKALLTDLKRELETLLAHDAALRDTTLLIAPDCLPEFLEFNDFLAEADHVLVELELDGVIQIASMHPLYQFAETVLDDITNFTNRSPYPILHLLREESIDRAVQVFPEAETIFERNMQTMERLGHGGWATLDVSASSMATHREAARPADDVDASEK